MNIAIFVLAAVVALLSVSVKVLNEYERGVVFRIGRLFRVKGPGLIVVLPVIDTMVRISLRVVTLDIPTQDIITKDNVSVKVNAVVYFKVLDPDKAIVEVEDFYYATGQLSQTSLRSVLGQVELDELLSERDKINVELKNILDIRTDPWGIKIENVEIKHVDLPTEMQRAMAKQAEAERERRAKIISAEGEFQAATKLGEAAVILDKNPSALTLRYLQTMNEISSENNSTTFFPLPINLLEPFLPKHKGSQSS
ncbi:MAG: slipin family protein [Nitrospinota bacterium]